MQQRIHTYVACLTLCCGYYPLNLMGITWGLMDQKKWRMAQTCKFHGWDKESMINFWGSLFSGKTRWTSQKTYRFMMLKSRKEPPIQSTKDVEAFTSLAKAETTGSDEESSNRRSGCRRDPDRIEVCRRGTCALRVPGEIGLDLHIGYLRAC